MSSRSLSECSLWLRNRLRRRRLNRWHILGAISLAALLLLARDGPATRPARSDPGSAEGGVQRLLGGKAYYLQLDVRGRALSLRLQGTVLDEYPVQGLEVGTGRRFFFSREIARWNLKIWQAGRVDPPRPVVRVEVRAPVDFDPEKEGVPLLPLLPTAEETIRAPAVFRLSYHEGLSVVVDSDSDVSRGWGKRGHALLWQVGLWLDDFAAAFEGEGIRLRIHLLPEDAGRLYRSLPEGSALLLT